jgi:hypothetical protein
MRCYQQYQPCLAAMDRSRSDRKKALSCDPAMHSNVATTGDWIREHLVVSFAAPPAVNASGAGYPPTSSQRVHRFVRTARATGAIGDRRSSRQLRIRRACWTCANVALSAACRDGRPIGLMAARSSALSGYFS